MYMPGRLRTASRPSSTVMFFDPYSSSWLLEFELVGLSVTSLKWQAPRSLGYSHTGGGQQALGSALPAEISGDPCSEGAHPEGLERGPDPADPRARARLDSVAK